MNADKSLSAGRSALDLSGERDGGGLDSKDMPSERYRQEADAIRERANPAKQLISVLNKYSMKES